jgi:hypothetical protein
MKVSPTIPEMKECPLGHGNLFIHTECCEDHNHIIFEPVIDLPDKFYVMKREEDAEGDDYINHH